MLRALVWVAIIYAVVYGLWLLAMLAFEGVSK